MNKKALIHSVAALSLICVSVQGQAVSSDNGRTNDRTATHSRTGDPRSAEGTDAPLTLTPLSPEEAAIQSQIQAVFRTFYDSYRLGPGDVLGVYVDRHPDDSLSRVVVTPVGRIYYPLLGNVGVAGKTLRQLEEFLTVSVSEFIRAPRVTVALLEAQSAKIGVLGDVRAPGVILLSRPMRVLDAITAAGGIAETGNASRVSIVRQHENGRVQVLSASIKKILQGKAGPEENIHLAAGDTIVVHGNTFKTISRISSIVGMGSFFSFLLGGGR